MKKDYDFYWIVTITLLFILGLIPWIVGMAVIVIKFSDLVSSAL